jgi:nucleobase:cation symporter-1, NCS1 family
MIVDYFFIRHKKLILNDLYTEGGVYNYKKDFNWASIIALLTGIIPNIFGFLTTIKVVSIEAFPLWLSDLYNYAWFVGFIVSGLVYWILMRKKG